MHVMDYWINVAGNVPGFFAQINLFTLFHDWRPVSYFLDVKVRL